MSEQHLRDLALQLSRLKAGFDGSITLGARRFHITEVASPSARNFAELLDKITSRPQ